MVLENKIFIKENLLNSNQFVVESNDIITIDRMITNNNWIQCIFLHHEKDCHEVFLCDQIACDPFNNQINILNTRSLSYINQYTLEDGEIASLYQYTKDSILIIIDKKGN